MKKKALVCEAERWVGVIERPENQGELVRLFQMAVDQKAQGESWCVAFVHYCVNHVDRLFRCINMDQTCHGLPKTESSQELWKLAAPQSKSKVPSVGSIAVWTYKNDPIHGHVGIVKVVKADTIITIEGNTKEQGKPNSPEGVYEKTRMLYPTGNFSLLGFIEPWR